MIFWIGEQVLDIIVKAFRRAHFPTKCFSLLLRKAAELTRGQVVITKEPAGLTKECEAAHCAAHSVARLRHCMRMLVKVRPARVQA